MNIDADWYERKEGFWMQWSVLSSRLAGRWTVCVAGHWPQFTLPLSRTLAMGSAQTLPLGSPCKVVFVHAAVLDLDHGSPCKVLSVHAAVLDLDHGSTCKVLSVHAAVLDRDHGSPCKVLSIHAAVLDRDHGSSCKVLSVHAAVLGLDHSSTCRCPAVTLTMFWRERQTVSTATSSWTYHCFSLSRAVKVEITDMFLTWPKNKQTNKHLFLCHCQRGFSNFAWL